MTPLQDRLLAAHARDDRAALVGLYTEAADAAPDLNAACFYLTHAYIYALEKGDPAAEQLYHRLKAQGRV
ncbi:hypothetical protein SAMN05421665_1018 [Yoonia rosea]|uniref:Tetratricopeptide repeat-containing protein n=1 Tax=Yoonia rosea TaxID=287098 RepID=A0A1R3WPR2_9RHOB|nr:hypothetical protein [Yoonia rosea]SIT79871.1 hypothetical protein SAMN05421665_1018 [Yoonia rosea]